MALRGLLQKDPAICQVGFTFAMGRTTYTLNLRALMNSANPAYGRSEAERLVFYFQTSLCSQLLHWSATLLSTAPHHLQCLIRNLLQVLKTDQ